MNKSSTIWIIAALCVIIVLTAFGVVTNRMIQEDVQHSQQIVDAHREGRIRLAMWRLDTLAASIIANEDERSVYEFRKPMEANSLQSEPENSVNPLYFNKPETANLYWNLKPGTIDQVDSPQVYDTSYLSHNRVDPTNNEQNSNKLRQFKQILETKNKLSQTNNGSLMYQSANVSLDNWGAANQIATAPEPNPQDFSYGNYAQTNSNNQQLEETITAPNEQLRLTIADKGSRIKAVARISSGKRSQAWNNNIQQNLQLQTTPLTTEDKNLNAINPSGSKLETTILPSIPSDAQSSMSALTEEPFSTPFTPLWVNDELMLVRKVSEPSNDMVQGVWLNKDIIIQKLLDEIHDLFPNAQLVPVAQDIIKIINSDSSKGDETTMFSLPLQLIHNDPQLVQTSPVEYLYGPIGLAWLGAILAIIACYYMLRNVLKMSERRAAFVSSVTHELRTPLTTFRLYSDLLSSGMVKDPEKQQIYLNTLKHESERLSHLVENVLAYSQIERGNAKAKVEPISLYQLIQRIEPRLNERATEEDMIVNVIYSESSADEILHIDTTAVEQIIFNLVDNACKYASDQNHGREITLVAEVTNRKLHLKICDQGDGIARSEQKRLFKPFHKSAKEAAHTKPGVGLGLALCKRLARAMQGDLSISKNTKTKGACFQLTLPK